MSLFSDKVVASAVFGRRFAGLALADVDLQTYKTWDPVLARSHRILVPIDVQAYVVPAVGGEEYNEDYLPILVSPFILAQNILDQFQKLY